MRRVKVAAPAGTGVEIAKIAHAVGIDSVRLTTETELRSNGETIQKDVVDASISTPQARAYVRALTASPHYDRGAYAIDVRGARSVFSHDTAEELTYPFARPESDVVEELWQFSHITTSFVVRTVIAGSILTYGVLEGHLLVIVAGLMFLPLVPTLLAIGFGIRSGCIRLARQGALALCLGLTLVVMTAASVATVIGPPMAFADFGGIWTSLVLAVVVGIAAAYATADDAGSKEMVSLAAASQVALTAAWIGIRFALGPEIEGGDRPLEKLASLALNCAAIAVAGAVAYSVVGLRRGALPPERRSVQRGRARPESTSVV